jgi:serine/threonine protein kinase/tetratricopeptide (TPR) repeat protein
MTMTKNEIIRGVVGIVGLILVVPFMSLFVPEWGFLYLFIILVSFALIGAFLILGYITTLKEKRQKAKSFMSKAKDLASHGQFFDAIKTVDQALALQPDNDELQHLRVQYMKSEAEGLASRGRYLDAIEMVDQALALQPDNDELQHLRVQYMKSEAEGLASRGRYLNAIKTVDQALSLQPDNDELQHLRAQYVNLHAQYVKSKEAKAKAKAGAKAEAKDLISRGQFLDAIDVVDQALALQPDNDELQHLRAKYVNLHTQYAKAEDLASRGQFRDAIEMVDQALALQPDNDKLQHVRAQYERDNARRPDLHISLETTPLRSGSWQQISATLTNSGSADALGIGIALSDDFEVRRVDTCTVEAGGSETIEIPLLPKHGGHVPLDITLTYEDPWSRRYSTSEEFWIDVSDIMSFTHASRDTPVSPVSGFSPQPLTPKQFPTELADRYRDISFIGKGGFGRVFRATRPDNTEVAVKIPLSIDAATGKSFIAELQSWTRLSHPNIVKLYDYNIMPMPYFEMEYCERALTDMEKPMAPREAAGIIFNICEGVKVAHNQRIIHRDLKPQNILIKNGVPKVSDWGLSKVVTESRTSTTTSFTAYYAAPEQINNTGKDERADIWQIGVIFYELVTGVLPFTGESMVGVVSAITMKNPQPPSKIVAESSDVESIILKCLEKEPDNRFQSVLELQKELARYLEWNYSQELRNSISSGNGIQAAYYCGELVMTALHTGDASSAYKYLSDLLIYTKGDLQVNTRSLADNVQFMVENDIEVSADIIRKADLLIHQIRSRR